MNPESQLLLEAFWSWTAGIVAVGLLGVLAPLGAGLLVGSLPLMHARRDFRPAPQFAAIILLFLGIAIIVIASGPHRGPAIDFWIVLSLQVAVITSVVSVGLFLRMSMQRVREEREQIDSLTSIRSGPDQAVAAMEPGARARLNAIDAEYYVAEWMRTLGAVESTVTRARRDGGVDVRSAHYVAQVKHRPQDFVSVDVIRALHGVAVSENRTGLVFASGRYSSDALSFARDAGVALFIFRPQQGRLVAANAQAERLRRDGLRAEQRSQPAGRA